MTLERRIETVFVILAFVWASSASALDETRGVGVYPGNPKEDFGPGERRTIRIEIETADARGETPRIELRGFELLESEAVR